MQKGCVPFCKENSYKKANIELDKKIKEEFEKSKRRYGVNNLGKFH